MGYDVSKLKGVTFVSAEINEDNTELLLKTNEDKSVYLVAVADCCSETWFENITGTDALLNNEILEVKQKDLGDADGTRQEYDQKYSLILETQKGSFEIEYRNSSNGYYGGSIYIQYEQRTQNFKNRQLKDF